MQIPMNAPLARNSKSTRCPAPTFAARVKMMPMTSAAIAHIGSNRKRRCSIITGMSRSSPNRLDLAIVVAVAFIANFVYLFFSSGDFYFPDSFTYLAPAKSLLAGSGFLSPLGNPDTIRTPGYPLLLALFGGPTLPVLVLPHLANVAIAVALYLFVLPRCGSPLMAIVAP